MSILQEYEDIKRKLGNYKWDKLDNYCIEKHILLSKVLYNEREWNKFEKWLEKIDNN